MIPNEGVYEVGEDILIKLELYNGYGDKVKRGGDDVRVRMVEINKQLTIAGRVKDYNNGTYIITIPTLWNGTNNVIIYMPYFREERVTFLTWTRQFNALSPTGYASKGKYFPMYCQINKTDEDIKTCLINTTVIFTGDSTTRHWFIGLRKFIECKQTVGTSNFKKWTRVAECEN
ncbi:NXPE family member 3-like, partial [Patella vulgata]|uniref:NXPE family member 3-like n=1 Tax=Patella vulgata TaxID=6465 RepID=UPI0024A7DC55